MHRVLWSLLTDATGVVILGNVRLCVQLITAGPLISSRGLSQLWFDQFRWVVLAGFESSFLSPTLKPSEVTADTRHKCRRTRVNVHCTNVYNVQQELIGRACERSDIGAENGAERVEN